MKKVLYLMLVIVLASSCATGYYAPRNVNQFGTQTQVVLSEANFRIVRNLEVVIDVNNTDLRRADVEKSAYAELLRAANLTGTQALINVVIEEVRRESPYFFPMLFGVRTSKVVQHVAARGTIIEFLPKGEQIVLNTGNSSSIEKIAVSDSPERSASNTSTSSSIKEEVVSDLAQEEANKYYMAWLYKTQRLKVSKETREQMSKYNFDEIVQIASMHSIKELKKMSEGYDKELRVFGNYK